MRRSLFLSIRAGKSSPYVPFSGHAVAINFPHFLYLTYGGFIRMFSLTYRAVRLNWYSMRMGGILFSRLGGLDPHCFLVRTNHGAGKHGRFSGFFAIHSFSR